MDKPHKDRSIDKIVNRVRDDSYFLGKILSEYEALHGIDDQQLARYLECEYDTIARLFLCSVPSDMEQQFQKDVARIADFASCDANKLITILRETGSVIALRGETINEKSNGLLMAARDRHDERKNKTADIPPKPRSDDNAGENKK